jgi:hypothetical protein
MTAYQETTEARLECEEPASVDMESEVVHEEFCAEDAAVKSLGTIKKRHTGRHLAAGQCGQPKELTQGICGSWRTLAATCRKVSHCAAVARSKRNVFRKIWTQRKCGPWKELATASRRLIQSPKVAWHRGHDDKRYDQDNVVQETQRV